MTSVLRSSLLGLLQESAPEWAAIEEAADNDGTHKDRLCTIRYKTSVEGTYSFGSAWLSDIYLSRATTEVTGLKVLHRRHGRFESGYFELADPDVIELVWQKLISAHRTLAARATE